jgi:hypothetical protein
MGVSGQRHAPAVLYPRGKDPWYPLDRRLRGAAEPIWTQGLGEKSSASVGDRTPIVQPVVRHYTDLVTAAPLNFRDRCFKMADEEAGEVATSLAAIGICSFTVVTMVAQLAMVTVTLLYLLELMQCTYKCNN